MSFIESLKAAGIVASEYDRTTGWPKFMNLDRLVILQYPEDDSEQIGLHRTLKGACRRKEITSTPAMAWAGLYLSSPDVHVPFDRLLETTDLAIDAPAFSEWLKRSDTEPSVHVAAWFAKFGILERTTAPATDTATPAPVVAVVAPGGTATLWTTERKTAARAMLGELRGSGNKAFAANTAAAFGVTATRLRQVLNDKPKKAPTKKAKSVWDV